MKQLVRAAAFAVLLSSTALAGITQKGESEARFSGKGPAGFKLEGKTQEVKLAESGSNVLVTVPLAGLDTGIELRNRHMREKYLETGKYPEAVLEVLRSAISLPADGKSVEGKSKGKMTLHGKSREVAFTYVIKRVGDVYQVQGKVPLNLKDFDIHIPSYLGVTVKPDIETAVSFAFQE